MTNELTMWADLQNKALEVEAAWLRYGEPCEQD